MWTRLRLLLSSFGVILLGVVVFVYLSTTAAITTYESFASSRILDRNGTLIYQAPNERGYYTLTVTSFPETLEQLVISKEDQYFYLHPGINPASISRALLYRLRGEPLVGASTITQQLAKIIYGANGERTLVHKFKEALLAISLEIRLSKETILEMYLNAVPLGNQAQGFAQASWVYYGKPLEDLSEADLASLVVTLSNPTRYNPWQPANQVRTDRLIATHNLTTGRSEIKRNHQYNTPTAFEIRGILQATCTYSCHTTIDATLTEQVRTLASDHGRLTSKSGATELAVVVIDAASQELLAIVGSTDPFARTAGSQINMALQSRPIGSTIKPFIYAEAFQHGARPYSLIADQEYKYPIGTGFPLYPKNYDGQYYGDVTLQYALANSLNTPSIKLLEFISLEEFYSLLETKLQFTPINPLSSYAYGIALGGLEMDLLTLTHVFTVFPQRGTFSPLTLMNDDHITTPQSTLASSTRVFSSAAVELTNSILTNRAAGAQQFGLRSTLDTRPVVSAVKTGTSRDFHDSWTIGYTPDYVVGVWVGNAANTPLQELSGARGAGPLWRQVMELMATTEYHHGTAFRYEKTVPIMIENSLYRGIANDDVDNIRNVLLPTTLIISPHEGDQIVYADDTSIELSARASVEWFIDGTSIGSGTTMFWQPPTPGSYELSAVSDDTTDTRTLEIVATTGWDEW